MKSLHPLTRILLLLASLAMICGYFLPLWEILLWAPQYPEGLKMNIWLDHLSGDVEIINGLNHYIGMAEIHEEMFPELGYMKYALGALIVAGFLPALFGTRKWLLVFVAILFVGGGLGLYDFARWSYDYGHNLDPQAAISVPGMSYSPPLLGYKSLLNFIAYSGPDAGGWVLIGAGGLATFLLVFEYWRKAPQGKLLPFKRALAPASAVLLAVLLTGCDTKAQPIQYGKDECASCKMLITDRHYGAEWITSKGKLFKFDDIHCLHTHMGETPGEGRALVTDFDNGERLLDAPSAVYVSHPDLRSPMRSNTAAFSERAAADAVMRELGQGGKILTWEEVQQLLSGR